MLLSQSVSQRDTYFYLQREKANTILLNFKINIEIAFIVVHSMVYTSLEVFSPPKIQDVQIG